jgi:hypothetical protein
MSFSRVYSSAAPCSPVRRRGAKHAEAAANVIAPRRGPKPTILHLRKPSGNDDVSGHTRACEVRPRVIRGGEAISARQAIRIKKIPACLRDSSALA